MTSYKEGALLLLGEASGRRAQKNKDPRRRRGSSARRSGLGSPSGLDCTPKVRQKVKGPNTLNGERYGFGPTNIQPRTEVGGDA